MDENVSLERPIIENKHPPTPLPEFAHRERQDAFFETKPRGRIEKYDFLNNLNYFQCNLQPKTGGTGSPKLE